MYMQLTFSINLNKNPEIHQMIFEFISHKLEYSDF